METLKTILLFLLAHAAWIWFGVTFGINAYWDDAIAYVDTHPRWAIVKKLIQKFGLSPKGTTALLGALYRLIMKRPPPPAAGSGDVASLLSGLKTSEPPKPNVNLRTRFRFAFASLILLLTLVPMSLTLIACGSAPPITHDEFRKASLLGDDQICYTEAKDLDSGLHCLDENKRLYSPMWADSGMTVCPIDAKDGGK